MNLNLTKTLKCAEILDRRQSEKAGSKDRILAYYEKAGPDYEAWSPNFNMHFGFYQRGINPFRREDLLENMNRKVLSKLSITDDDQQLVDMGCGLGATLRYAAKQHPHLDLKGITIVPWQVEHGTQINESSGFGSRIQLVEEDYRCTSIPDNSADVVLAIESSCYAGGSGKEDLTSEIYRILKPGGRFVIADGFIRTTKPMNRMVKSIYRLLSESWALKGLGVVPAMETGLKKTGFKKVQIEDISWRVAPSVAHVPFTVISFLVKQWLFGKREMTQERWDNLKSPLLTLIIGLIRSHFGYFLISGKK